jgi:TP901 family phage tail tape measure protein
MAVDLEKIVKIIFQGDDQLSQTINSLGRGLDQFSYRVTDATQPLADLTRDILAIDAALAALAVGGLYVATDQAGQFGDSFNEIATLLTGVSEQGLEDFRDDIEDFAASSVSSLEDINESIYQAISAGTDYKDSVDLVGQAETLAVATKGTLADSVRLLTQTINSLGAENITAEQAADLYFTTIQGGVTRIDELAGSLGQVLPVAASLNVPLQTVTASMIALTQSGLSTSQAVTALNALFSSILSGGTNASAILGENASAFSATAVQARGFETVLRDVVDAVDGDVEALNSLVGRKEAFLAITTLGIDANGNFARALDLTAQAAGRAAEAYRVMAQNYELINQNLINNLRLTLIEIGEPLLNDWARIAQGLSTVFQTLQVEIPRGAFDPVFNLLEEVSIDINEFLISVADALPEALSGINWDDFIQSLRDLGTAAADLFADIFGDLDLTNADDLRRAIQQVIDGVTLLINVTTGIAEAIGPFLDQLRQWAEALIATDSENQQFIGNVLGAATAINTISRQIPALTDGLNLLAGSIGLLSATRIPGMITALSGATGLTAAISGAAAALAPFAAGVAALGAGYWFGTELRENSEEFRALGDAIGDAYFTLVNGWSPSLIDAKERQAEHTEELGRAAVATVRFLEELGELPDQKTVEVNAEVTTASETIYSWWYGVENVVPDMWTTSFVAEFDRASFNDVVTEGGVIIRELEDGSTVLIQADIDQASFANAANEADELTTPRMMEIRLQGDIDIELEQIRQNAETLRNAFEWEARVEITEIEQNLETVRQLSDDITEAFVNTGDVIQSIFGNLSGLSASETLAALRQLEEENRRRDSLLTAQLALTNAEIQWLNARNEALERGDAMIRVESSNVYPELDLILQRIIERAQIQANAEGYDYLLGG